MLGNRIFFTNLNGLLPWCMAKSGGAWRQSPWLPLTTRLSDILLASLLISRWRWEALKGNHRSKDVTFVKLSLLGYELL